MTAKGHQEPVFTFRQYATRKLLMNGIPLVQVKEAVATTFLEHPDWDELEPRTLAEWEKLVKK